MRFVLPLLAAAMLALPVYANADTTTHHKRQTMEQLFQRANATHDGHLTLDQAKSGYKSVARHFAAIDQDNKGYVTEADIKAYNKTQRALHHQTAPADQATP